MLSMYYISCTFNLLLCSFYVTYNRCRFTYITQTESICHEVTRNLKSNYEMNRNTNFELYSFDSFLYYSMSQLV